LKNFTLNEWIDWQCTLHSTNMDFNLSRIKEVARRLNVHKTVVKVFTVAGTNGKGSTVAILESVLLESGYNVGSYTSPHLIEFNERIKINKISADTEEICKAFELIEENRKDTTLTFFEFSTLAALIIFSQKNLDVIILEVGLGGRLDAVNIIDPDVSIITSIGYDHTAILGDDLELIAFEKSGIMRKNKPTIISYENIHQSIIKNSKEIGSNLEIINKNFSYKIISDKKWLFSNIDGVEIESENPGIKGLLQINNAASVLQALHICDGIELNNEKAIKGIKNSSILGRFQIINSSPVTVLDIAHNEQSIEILIKNLKEYFPHSNYHAVFSVLKDKNVNQMLNLAKEFFKSWHISNSDNERALEVKELKLNNFFILEETNTYDSIEEAYKGALEYSKKENDVIVVFGSSYTVSPILNFNSK
jgi:dihydrofolate synthase/folylpolyglutamate synthase